MKSANIDKEILEKLFEKIIESEETTDSFKVSEETKKVFKEILNSSIINPYTNNVDKDLKNKIVFFKQKIIELIRKEYLLENWEDAPYLKLEEKAYILEDINNIETFIKFYYLVIKNITDKIKEYKRNGDKNNMKIKNIDFFKKLLYKIDDFKEDNLYQKYKNELDLMETDLKIEIKISDSDNKSYLIENWEKIKYISTKDKIIIINSINTKENLILFYKRFENSLKSLNPKNNTEKEIIKTYLELFYNKFIELRDSINKKKIEEYNYALKNIEYYKDKYSISKESMILKHWKKRTRLSLDDKIYILNNIHNKEDFILFINNFKGNIENMTSKVLKNQNKINIIKIKQFFENLLNKSKEYKTNLELGEKLIYILNKNIKRLGKNQ